MIHILLIILKIIGIALLVLLGLLLFVLLFPITYKVKGECKEKQYHIKVKLGWLFHIVHFSVLAEQNNTRIKLRIFGIPINIFDKNNKEKRKKPKKKKRERLEQADAERRVKERNNLKTEEEKTVVYNEEAAKISKENNESAKEGHINDEVNALKNMFLKIKTIVLKLIEKIKIISKDIKDAYKKATEFKKLLQANTTKEAYRYGKKILLKIVKHIFPSSVKANIHYGFEEPDVTGKTLGYIAIVASIFHVNLKKILIEADFDKKVLEGNIKIRGSVVAGVLLYYAFRFYFKKEIRSIIKKYI